MNAFQQFNRYTRNDPNLIAKALSTASGVGAGFSPQSLEKIVTDTMIKLQPELALVQSISIASKQHEFNQKTALPLPGGAMGESATTPATNSKNLLATVPLKVIRRKGQVTNFLKDVSREVLDIATYELQNQLQAHALDLRNYLIYGNAPANAYEFSGLDYYIATNRVNEARGGAVPTSLSVLDDMLDANIRKGGNGHNKCYLMSPEMLSMLSRLETTIRKTERITAGFDLMEVTGGWRLASYRGVPIIQTSATRPIQSMLPTVTATADNKTGTLSDGIYNFVVAPITYEGEQLASANAPVTLSGGGSAQSIKITLSDYQRDVASTGNANVYAYKIYYGSTSTTHKLIRVVPASTYDGNGTPTLNNGLTGQDFSLLNVAVDSSVTTAMSADVPLVSTGSVAPESIILWDLDPIQGLGKVPFTNTAGSNFNGLVTVEELAKIDDYLHFLIKSYCALAPSWEATSFLHRGLRVA